MDYVGITEAVEIVKIYDEEKTNKNGDVSFKQTSIEVMAHGDDFVIRYLFEQDLNDLISCYGEEDSKWVGKIMKISAREDKINPKTKKPYYRWVLRGIPEEVEIK